MSSCLLGLWLLAAPTSDWTPVERVLAVVDDDLVLASELDDRIDLATREISQIPDPAERARQQTDLRKKTLETLVDELLIAHEAARLHVEITDADLDAAVAMIKTHNNLDDAAFDRAVAASDRTMAEYRAQNRRDMLRFKLFLTLFHGRITITDAAVEAAHRAAKLENPNLGDLAAETERLRAALYTQALTAEGDRWLAEARRTAHVELRP